MPFPWAVAARRDRWHDLPVETQLNLVADDLDEFEGVIRRVNTKLNWMVGLFVSILVALVINLAVLVLTVRN